MRTWIRPALACTTMVFAACDPESAGGAHNDAAIGDLIADSGTSNADASQASGLLDAASEGGVIAAECNVRAPTSCPTPAPRYADVTPIITDRCLTCHDGQPMGPWPLTDYQHVADWAAAIRDELLKCTMPPPEAAALADRERDLLLAWVRCGSKP